MNRTARHRLGWQALLIVWLAFAVLAGSMLPAFTTGVRRLCGG